MNGFQSEFVKERHARLMERKASMPTLA